MHEFPGSHRPVQYEARHGKGGGRRAPRPQQSTPEPQFSLSRGQALALGGAGVLAFAALLAGSQAQRPDTPEPSPTPTLRPAGPPKPQEPRPDMVLGRDLEIVRKHYPAMEQYKAKREVFKLGQDTLTFLNFTNEQVNLPFTQKLFEYLYNLGQQGHTFRHQRAKSMGGAVGIQFRPAFSDRHMSFMVVSADHPPVPTEGLPGVENFEEVHQFGETTHYNDGFVNGVIRVPTEAQMRRMREIFDGHPLMQDRNAFLSLALVTEACNILTNSFLVDPDKPQVYITGLLPFGVQELACGSVGQAMGFKLKLGSESFPQYNDYLSDVDLGVGNARFPAFVLSEKEYRGIPSGESIFR